ncbi:hypothetical protein Hamer_G000692 [Homarus americanus]|uniref:Uncharacterized protein n=1 Tax=Homarus americanus TaxID=6706 RepID=A0A8J5T1I9_HOMAM|nr:hypothetical protein Hamer_G000692 [Homarus americanus]
MSIEVFRDGPPFSNGGEGAGSFLRQKVLSKGGQERHNTRQVRSVVALVRGVVALAAGGIYSGCDRQRPSVPTRPGHRHVLQVFVPCECFLGAAASAHTLCVGAAIVNAGYVPQVGSGGHVGASGGYGGAAAVYHGVQSAYSGYGGGGGIGYGHGGSSYYGPSELLRYWIRSLSTSQQLDNSPQAHSQSPVNHT